MTKVKLSNINFTNMTSIIVLLLLAVTMAILSPVFLSYANLVNSLQQVTINAIIALGMSVVIFTGGIDLSVGSVLAFCGIVLGGMIVNNGIHLVIACVCTILVGAACGCVNGILVARFKLQPMIATLGTMSIARGAALTLAGGRTISNYPMSFQWIGSGTIGGTGIPVQILFMLLLYLLLFYVLRFRKVGRYIYSIGGNEEATRLSGINVMKYKIIAYIIGGALSAVAAIILVSKLNSAQSIAGEGYELDAIAASVIGGASLLGGAGSVWGTMLGAIIMGIIRNGLNLMNVSSYSQRIIIGIIILAAVMLDSIRSGKSSRT
jgi:ribose transport system permease protein